MRTDDLSRGASVISIGLEAGTAACSARCVSASPGLAGVSRYQQAPPAETSGSDCTRATSNRGTKDKGQPPRAPIAIAQVRELIDDASELAHGVAMGGDMDAGR
ncbi:MAG TPA: hypothetical protein QGF35_04340 [Dehalococcoidia bacterium]|nr:hypothetical protein [Dehalococcoidia bacterium]